ncbi:MAG: hypothetical protein Q8K92_13385 [Leadbetterella sp.]|nr:hypothetical protein [Leadbetterella sp.]
MEISQEYYNELKELFKNADNLQQCEPQQCVNFYSGWWKYDYEEGKPSKELVFKAAFSSIQKPFSVEDFYQKAVEGGKNLKLQWIRRENTLYFRTLLLQGRIPLKSLQKHTNYWKDFLIKVIEKHPYDIEAISNDYEIIKKLPLSTRNEGVYEAALKISNAIWDETEEGKEILQTLEQNNQEDLVVALRIEKEQTIQNKQNIKIKAVWELNLNGKSNKNIYLKIDIPQKLKKEVIESLIGVDSVANSYNLTCNEFLIANYKKNLSGDYLKYTVATEPMYWDANMIQRPILVISDNQLNTYPLPHQIKTLPSIEEPTFWVQLDDARWNMLPNKTFNGQEAFLLTNCLKLDIKPQHTFSVDNQEMCLFKIDGNTNFEGLGLEDNQILKFSENDASFDWLISTNQQPNWIHQANMPVIKGNVDIFFFDNEDKRINQVDKRWRKKGEIAWKELKELPIGIIELRFCYNNNFEYDTIFNLGKTNLMHTSENVLVATLTLDNPNLNLSVYPNDILYTTELKNKTTIALQFIKTNQIPKKLRCNLEGLIFDFLMPIKISDIVDNEDRIIENEHVININNLYGFRIVKQNLNPEPIKIYNHRFTSLYVTKELIADLTPLINFNAIIHKIFMLGDPMNPENKVVIKIANKTFYFQGYTNQISFINAGRLNISIDNRLLINLIKNVDQDFKEDFCMYAVPLNCELSNINVIELEKYCDGFSFPESIKETQFIVFDNNKDKDCKILPTYVTTSEENIVHPLDPAVFKERKKERIETFAKSLFDQNPDEEEWQKLLQYVKICSDFQLPLSAFDNLRAACSNSDLTARLFFFLLYYSSHNEEFMKRCEKFEQELGFKFYWCSFDSFGSAVAWVEKTWTVDYKFLFETAATHVKSHHLHYNDNDWVFDGTINDPLRKMRGRLGDIVLRELPRRWPWLPEERKNIIQITDNMPVGLKVMARCPISIGLSKLNLYSKALPEGDKVHDIWHFENHEVRRNIIYCEELDKNWFDFAIKYTIHKTKNI